MKGVVHRIVQDVERVKKEIGHFPTKAEYIDKGRYGNAITQYFGSWVGLERAIKREKEDIEKAEKREPKILSFDIETRPLEVYSWGIFEQNIGINQIKTDWHVLCFAAKWYGKHGMFYKGNRDEKEVLQAVWNLLDEADVVLTQNGKQFDAKKLNARFLINKMKPPSPYQHIDTRQLARKTFGFTSYSLEYMCNALDTEHKKMKHERFPGMELWTECLKGNKQAWEDMETYNKNDVLCLEDVYEKLRPWGSAPGVDLSVYHGDAIFRCQCGSVDLQKRGFDRTKIGKFQKYQCQSCGAWTSARGAANNLLSEKKRLSLRGST